MDPLEHLWEELLSEDPSRISAIWATLEPEEQTAIHEHLTMMATEEGWADVQRDAAKVALDALKDKKPE